MNLETPPAMASAMDDVASLAQRPALDLRLVLALAGERELNAREQQIVDKLKSERGESLFSDMLYTLTRKSFPSRQAKTLWADVTHHRLNLGKLLGRDPGVAVAAHDYLTNVSGVLKSAALIEESKFNMLATVASRDGLTGLYDKSTFTRLLHEEISRQARHKRLCTLVLADIDHFKRLNDTFGHADGDIVLVQVAEIIANQCRTTDVPGRFGGEEFAVILPEVDSAAGLVFAERVRAEVEKRFADTPYLATLSLGVATANPEGSIHAAQEADVLIRRADAALYAAKHAGRNRVKISEA